MESDPSPPEWQAEAAEAAEDQNKGCSCKMQGRILWMKKKENIKNTWETT